MGKKYIIELLDDCQSEFKGIMAFGLTQEKQISVELIPEEGLRPYTEPDLEQVKADAYNDGYKAGREAEEVRQKLRQPDLEQVRKEAYDDGYNAGYGRKIDASYQEGLADAWEAARTLWNTPNRKVIFGHTTFSTTLTTLTAQEAIEKIRQYEQIQVGDEVKSIERGWTAVVVRISNDESLILMDSNGAIADAYNKTMFVKTGRHFPEIAEVLQKMQMKDGDNE